MQIIYNQPTDVEQIQIYKTRKDFKGDYTVVVFPFLKASKKGPEQTATEIGNYLLSSLHEVEGFNVVKGFLNLNLSKAFWVSFLNQIMHEAQFGLKAPGTSGKTVMVEYSSPNTNKPLHLGHIRNNLLGYAVSEILKANGHLVIKANLVNDRGIHICKSMLAWQKWGKGATPESTGLKGDKLVGDFYVKFDQEYKKEIAQLESKGFTNEEAKEQAPIIQEAREMLRKWEAGNKEINELWFTMNHWVYQGFDVTYKNLGVDFDKIYYESETYKLGKSLVLDGLKNGVLIQQPDSSVWADLTGEGLDQKILLRSDGTSVYMTQDLGTAHQRFQEYHINDLIYVVGNEQNYHFQVLKLVLKKLGFDWSENIQHLSYGMVELPEGKMKSREGTVVDADDLIVEMIQTARETSQELGKLEGFSKEEAEKVFQMVGLGALKYFILKVDPKKTMLFNPKESIDFNGNTGPFIQYTHARIRSIIRKAKDTGIEYSKLQDFIVIPADKEIELIKLIYTYPEVIAEAGANYSPAFVANYIYELAKEFNQYYHDFSIMKEPNREVQIFRLALSEKVAAILKSGALLLGIHVPERM
ncbi:MAG: arginine--tRNA ligase [Salinivirgaceae bacterium]|nr:arginine--tRNA ligase [Salinivirgaceae bacterium]